MRLNWPPITCATVRMASVFARPGTPSTRMWPRESRATSMRSINWSWPTITRLISNMTCSIGDAGSCSFWVSTVIWPSRPFCPNSPCLNKTPAPQAGANLSQRRHDPVGLFDRHREPEADEHGLPRRIDDASDDSDYAAVEVDQRAARVS